MGKYLVILAGLVLLCGSGRADTVYDVTGTLTVTGNNVCGGPCVETLDFSFELESVLANAVPPEYFLQSVPGTFATVTSTGPLSGFTGGVIESQESGNFLGFDFNFIPFVDSGGDSFDVAAATGVSGTPIFPDIDAGGLYGCGTQTCVQDFCPTGSHQCSETLPIPGIFLNGIVQSTVTVVETPEPRGLIFIGLLGLFLLRGGREALDMRNRKIWISGQCLEDTALDKAVKKPSRVSSVVLPKNITLIRD